MEGRRFAGQQVKKLSNKMSRKKRQEKLKAKIRTGWLPSSGKTKTKWNIIRKEYERYLPF